MVDRQLTDAEKEKLGKSLESFKGRLGDEAAKYKDDHLMRFLIARAMDVDKTLEMWQGDQKWRAEYGTDAILLDPFPSDPADGYRSGFYGRDKAGNPLYIERPGKTTVKDFFAKYDMDLLVKWHVYIMEVGRRLYNENDSEGIVVIMDIGDCGWSHCSSTVISFIRAVSDLDQGHYPEHLRRCFIINAGMIFSGAWKMVSPLIDKRTQDKVKILGGQKDYLPILKEFIDEENIPKYFGGTGERNPDPIEAPSLKKDAEKFATVPPNFLADGADKAAGELEKASISEEKKE